MLKLTTIFVGLGLLASLSGCGDPCQDLREQALKMRNRMNENFSLTLDEDFQKEVQEIGDKMFLEGCTAG